MKIRILLCLLSIFLVKFSYGQVVPPYENLFDDSQGAIGWTHYAISGTDDWALGVPDNYYFKKAYSIPNAWVTGLTTSYIGYSERVLETPSFDFSTIGNDYVLSFLQKRHSASTGAYYYLEYSVDNSASWILLDNADVPKKNWQEASGFRNSVTSEYQHSAINISFLVGKENVKFRFRFVTGYANGEGWLIDNFSIAKEYYNIYATSSDSITVTNNCPAITLSTVYGFDNQYKEYVENTTHYYLSTDEHLDPSDNLLATKAFSYNTSYSNYSQSLNLPSDIKVGYYYLLYKHDALNVLEENDETDNIGYAVLRIDSVYALPFVENFEENIEPWKKYATIKDQPVVWGLGEGYRHHIEGTHSGNNAWHTSKSIEFAHSNQYVASPFVDLTSVEGDKVLNFWFKNHMDGNYDSYNIEASTDCGKNWNKLAALPVPRDDEWDYINVPLFSLASYNNVKFRIKFTTSYLDPEGLAFDDIYIGRVVPDLTIEKDLSNYFTSSSSATYTINYFLTNSGSAVAPESTTHFYWSNDSILDASDISLGSKIEPSAIGTSQSLRDFTISKPTTVPGKYFIIYQLDANEEVDEMREYNNVGYFSVYQENAATIPYSNNFESEINGWSHNATLGADDWQWTTPNGEILDTAFSGSKSWITNSKGLVSPMSRMHLYTPVFDLSTSTNPVLDFDMKLHSHPSCHCFEGKMNMSYSIDGGATWVVLDTTNQSYNRWYYPMEYNVDGSDRNYYIPTETELLFATNERVFTPFMQYNGRDSKRNTKYILDLKFLAGNPDVRFRFNLATLINNSESPNYPAEGALIDNFSITESFIDLTVDSKKSLMLSGLTKEVKFFMPIKNQGNYISEPGTVKYYLSADTVLDNADYLLGEVNIPAIRPDLYYYVNTVFEAPSNLAHYRNLIYKLDDANTSAESMEDNNVGSWSLGMDSVSGFSYYNSFNDSIVDGWHQYSLDPFGLELDNYRFRNMKAPGEAFYQTGIRSGKWFTDRVPSGSFNTSPYFFLESPSFHFDGSDSILLSFDLMCTGRDSNFDKDGGNLLFSTDGGTTWTLLTEEHGEASGWYNREVLNDLDNEAGWTGPPPGFGNVLLTPRSIDISFLKNEKNVVFRFKYKSNWEYFGSGTPQGMRVDNFTVQTFATDYVANEKDVLVNASTGSAPLNLNYSITNEGNLDGKSSITKFHWSKDAVFDIDDPLIASVTEAPVNAGSTVKSSVSINLELPITQQDYYIFYKADGDNGLSEMNEENNLGSFKIKFTVSANYLAKNQLDTVYLDTSSPTITVPYSISNNGYSNGTLTETDFYWSIDDILNEEDKVILSIEQPGIVMGETVSSDLFITYPSPLPLPEYYLFYKADKANQLFELDEEDNIGVFKVLINYINKVDEQALKGLQVYVYENELYVKSRGTISNEPYSLEILSISGNKISSSEILINEGINRYSLPENIHSGLYFFMIYNHERVVIEKGLIQR